MQFWSGLLYWCALWLLVVGVFAGGCAGFTQVLNLLTLIGPAPLLALVVPAIVAWWLQAGVKRTLMNAATALLLVSGLGFLLSKGGWQSTLGFSFGYASIALLVSAFLRPSIRGAGLPLITAAIVGWLVLTGMFAVALSLEGSSEDADVSMTGAYLEPNEFFAYLRGRLREHFIADPDEATSRIKALDNGRDPDGRFRVNELLCTNSTWQPTVLQMIANASVILLDLREYSQQRKGTRFELTYSLLRFDRARRNTCSWCWTGNGRRAVGARERQEA